MWPNSSGVQRIIDATNDPMSIAVTEALFADRRLLATRFARHGVSEAAGADLLRKVAGRVSSPRLRADLERHANDEARHARMFNAQARLTDLASAKCAMRTLPRSDHSGEGFDGNIPRFMASTHVAELRNQHLLGLYADRGLPMLGGRSATRTSAALSKVAADEDRHVAYTYGYVTTFMRAGALDADYLEDCAEQYARLVWWEIASIACDAAQLPAETCDRSRCANDLHDAFVALVRENGRDLSNGEYLFLETLTSLLPESLLHAFWAQSSAPPVEAKADIGCMAALRTFAVATLSGEPPARCLAELDAAPPNSRVIGEEEASALALQAARRFWLGVAHEAERRCA